MNQPHDVNPVLILGAGVNGCAVARELVLNGVPVTIVDIADIATGATAKSSRLIHGGLRYLEYADFHLVAESLHERERQLKLAPQFVKPLRLHIPVRRRLGGLVQAAGRFLGLTRFSLGRKLSARLSIWSERGLFAVRFGLWMYDWIARSSLLPDHTVQRVVDGDVPHVDPAKYRWICSYSDAQMLYPERFVIALLRDAQQHAAQHGVPFEVLTYHRAELAGRTVRIHPLDANGEPKRGATVIEIEPAVILNATGAWGDLTLDQLGIHAQRLFGGTKGSHIITRHTGLREAIGDGGIYAETGDGRLAFVLPFGEATLVGTTDLRFEQSPGAAVATPDEVRYLVDMVNSVLADVRLSVDDVDAHYCGVRPLPFVPAGKTGSIPRGHSIHRTDHGGIPLLTLIGGKLTTWRSCGEEVADRVFQELRLTRTVDTGDRLIPGGTDYPADEPAWCRQVAARTGHALDATAFLFQLMGTDAETLLETAELTAPTVPSLPVSTAIVSEIIRSEWVERLEDLVERRLALVLTKNPSQATLTCLADCLLETGKLRREDRDESVSRCWQRLEVSYGIHCQNGASGGKSV